MGLSLSIFAFCFRNGKDLGQAGTVGQAGTMCLVYEPHHLVQLLKVNKLLEVNNQLKVNKQLRASKTSPSVSFYLEPQVTEKISLLFLLVLLPPVILGTKFKERGCLHTRFSISILLGCTYMTLIILDCILRVIR